MKKSEIRKYILLSYPYVDRGGLSLLLDKFGYAREPLDIDFIYSLSDNPAFMAGYAQLVKEAQNTRHFKEAIDAGILNYVDGTNSEEDKKEEGKNKTSWFEWFSKITDSLLGGFGIFSDLKTGSSTAQANALAEQAKAANAMASASMIQYAVIGVVIVVIVVAIVVAFKKK